MSSSTTSPPPPPPLLNYVLNNNEKWIIAGWVSLFYFVVSLPQVYEMTNCMVSSFIPEKFNKNKELLVDKFGVTTKTGLLLHTIVFILIIRLIQETELYGLKNVLINKHTNLQKWIIACWAGILYIVLSNKVIYSITNELSMLISFNKLSLFYMNDVPHPVQILLHTIVFGLVVRGVLELNLQKMAHTIAKLYIK